MSRQGCRLIDRALRLIIETLRMGKVSEQRFLTRMALPSGMKGFTSCSGVQFLSKFVPGFLHECEQWLISPAH